MKKPQTAVEISKLVNAARQGWRFSGNYNIVKKNAKTKPGWYNCAACKRTTEKPKVDHIQAIGKQPSCMYDFGAWLTRLFCPIENLQVLCTQCHLEKTRIDRQKLKR